MGKSDMAPRGRHSSTKVRPELASSQLGSHQLCFQIFLSGVDNHSWRSYKSVDKEIQKKITNTQPNSTNYNKHKETTGNVVSRRK